MQTIIRRVLIHERDFPKMQQHCLVRSPHGNRQLYDTCEWQPITKHDLLLHLIRIPNSKYALTTYLADHRPNWYDRDYLYDYQFKLKDDVLVGRKKYSRYSFQFGWATVTKVKL